LSSNGGTAACVSNEVRDEKGPHGKRSWRVGDIVSTMQGRQVAPLTGRRDLNNDIEVIAGKLVFRGPVVG
jgi:hypothetical protein